MIRTTVLRLVLALAAMVALALPAAARAEPAPTRVAIAHNANWITQNLISLELSVSCTPGWSYSANVQVTQAAGFSVVSGSGFASGLCTGQHTKVAVTVFANFFPGWQLGEAAATVNLCALGCDGATRQISIALP